MSATALSFTSQLNTPTAQSISLSNSGSEPLTISSITLSGANTFSITSDGCLTANPPVTLRPNASCAIEVTFTPTSDTTQQGTLNVAVAAPAISQQATLTGVGTGGPAAVLSATALSFSSQVNTPATQTINLSNPGTTPLTINSITLSGAKAFSITNDGCLTSNSAATLGPNASCAIEVTFKPTSATTKQQGSLKVTVAAPATSQQVTLTGMSSDFSLPATPPSMTIVAGQSAMGMFPLSSVNGFSGPVALTCTIPSTMNGASCTVTNPVSVPINSTSDATLTVTTTAPQSTTLLRHGRIGGALGIFFVSGVLLRVPQRRGKPGTAKRLLLLSALAGIMGYGAGCGSGATSGSSTTAHGTPTGTYSVVVSATSGAITHTMKVSVVVKT